MDNFGVTKSNVKKEKLQVHCKSTIRQVNVLNYKISFRYKLPNACKFSSNYVWSTVIGYFTQKQFEGALESASGNMVQQPN